jgi:hypothetical protein
MKEPVRLWSGTISWCLVSTTTTSFTTFTYMQKKFCTFYYVAGTFSPSSTVQKALGWCKYFCTRLLLPCISLQVLIKLSSSILMKVPVTYVCCMCPVKLSEMVRMKPVLLMLKGYLNILSSTLQLYQLNNICHTDESRITDFETFKVLVWRTVEIKCHTLMLSTLLNE